MAMRAAAYDDDALGFLRDDPQVFDQVRQQVGGGSDIDFITGL